MHQVMLSLQSEQVVIFESEVQEEALEYAELLFHDKLTSDHGFIRVKDLNKPCPRYINRALVLEVSISVRE